MQTLQNYNTSSTRHIFQAKIKYYTILETSEAVLFDEMMKSKKILHMCSQNGVVTLMWLTLYVPVIWFFLLAWIYGLALIFKLRKEIFCSRMCLI